MAAIEASGLVKIFRSRSGEVRALDGVDLVVPEGTVLGLLGPNGAGKTTTVRVLTTLLKPDEGRAVVAGCDVVKDPVAVRRRIGLSGQYAAVDEYLTGRENLKMIGRLYHLGGQGASKRATELLERFDLVDAADRPVKGYSGGMRRRLDLAGALVANPPVLFLDEPTTGLDTTVRAEIVEIFRLLIEEQGRSMLYISHDVREVLYLANRVIVMREGQVVEVETADNLRKGIGRRAEYTAMLLGAADLPTGEGGHQ